MNKIRDINNYFGDMDLFLLDLILKGKIPSNAEILDVGCGEGRNAIYFIQEGFEYLGIDSDSSKIQLAQYMANNISTSKARFQIGDIRSMEGLENFDLILCSRVLHFADSEEDFFNMWINIRGAVGVGGMIYASMDSAIDNPLARPLNNGKFEFPDGAVRFAITSSIYSEIKKGFEEVEPLKTLVRDKTRAQSFFTLRKT